MLAAQPRHALAQGHQGFRRKKWLLQHLPSLALAPWPPWGTRALPDT